MEKTNHLSIAAEAIASRIYAGETDLMHDLWSAVERFVAWIATRYATIYTSSGLAFSEQEAFDDIYNGCGYPALCAAVEKYDPERGGFITLFLFCLRHEMRSFYGVRSQKADPILTAQSLNVKTNDDDDDRELLDFIEDDHDYFDDVERGVLQTQTRRLIDAALRELDEQQAFVIRGRYFDGITVKQLSETLDCKRSNVLTIERKAFTAIRSSRYKQPLYEALHPDIVTALSYRYTSIGAYLDTGERSTERAALEIIRLKDGKRNNY